MNRKILTVNEVSINQVAIEVKVMKIGSRQVTLAVFRQLPSERLVDEQTGELLGIPWGKVNYHQGMFCDCYYEVYPKSKGRHLHIIWQKGNELRQSSIIYSKVPDEVYHQLEQLDQLFIAV